MDVIFLPTNAAMNAEGRSFTVCLYFGLMMTPKGPKVIEYNCRFGDPETEVVLPRLISDIVEIFSAVADGWELERPLEWHDFSTVGVVLASTVVILPPVKLLISPGYTFAMGLGDWLIYAGCFAAGAVLAWALGKVLGKE